jgi:hypothetical protein
VKLVECWVAVRLIGKPKPGGAVALSDDWESKRGVRWTMGASGRPRLEDQG